MGSDEFSQGFGLVGSQVLRPAIEVLDRRGVHVDPGAISLRFVFLRRLRKFFSEFVEWLAAQERAEVRIPIAVVHEPSLALQLFQGCNRLLDLAAGGNGKYQQHRIPVLLFHDGIRFLDGFLASLQLDQAPDPVISGFPTIGGQIEHLAARRKQLEQLFMLCSK